MDVRQWNALQEAFNRLADMPPADQDRALRDLQRDNPTLAQELEELLAEDAAGGQLPELNVESLLQEALHPDQALLPSEGRIGPYRILRPLGEGGMGVVYLAERTDIAGYVAIKLLRDAWLSPIRRQRFAFEQQMLGLLNHPCIARIYNAGTTGEGTPWFVMEFTDGVPITEYLRARDATARVTMQLFATVCEAVRYAHSHAIIHRDLKPSNILITDDGRAKLLDFGIAKQMDLIDLGNSSATIGLRLFTPAYAAPELQSENSVGVFTDIYSLGVILYEMLTGSRPFAENSLKDRVAIRPSAKRGSASIDRSPSKGQWADLDAICMKALEANPDDRYASADALLNDVKAFLEDRPIEARTNAYFYAAGKFIQRNRTVLLSIGLAVLILIAGTVVFTVRLARARNAAARARDEAIAAVARNERIESFTESLFTGGQELDVPAPDISVIQMLDRGNAEALSLTADPLLQSEMFRVLGSGYMYLGRFGKAEPLLRRAKDGLCSSAQDIHCAQVELVLGKSLIRQHSASVEGEALLSDALRIAQRTLPPGDIFIATAEVAMGWAFADRGDRADALPHFAKALAIASAVGKPTHALAYAMDAYGYFVYAYNDPRALDYQLRAGKLVEQLFGRNSFEYAANLLELGTVTRNLGRYGEAEAYFREAVAAMQAWTGPNQRNSVGCMEGLAFVLILEGKMHEAIPLLNRSLQILSQSNEPPGGLAGGAYFYLGFAELKLGQLARAEAHFNQVIALSHRGIASTDSDLQVSRLGLADIYARRGEYERSEQMSRQALASGRVDNDYGAVAAHSLLGRALLREGRPQEAETELHKAYLWFSHDPAIRPHTVETYQALAEVESRLGHTADAARIRAELRAHPR
jgi:tetratricopeptide (TPR) repeat protein/tRNA A-37 threonylcarbamoyl transferase component Bud32